MIIFGGESDMAGPIKALYPKAVLISHEMCDVINFRDIENVLELHKPKVVINLAGVSNLQPIIDSNVFDWWDEIEVNCVGSYLVSKMSFEHGAETVILMGSVAGKYGKPLHSGYSASKAGVISLVQSLAMEGHNAYCISPGRVNTKMREKDFPGEDINTRLETKQIAQVVKEILDGHHKKGDNIIIRKKGYKTLRLLDRGEPWKIRLQVGKPPLV